jgi:hypothetical protein
VATEGLDIDREVSRMKEGDALSEVPTLMTLGETRTVTLILSPDSPTTKVVEEEQRQSLSNRNQEAPKRDLERKTRIETEKAYYSRFMEAKLSGQGFEIKAITPERQPVSNYQPTKWSWDVKATARGDQYLYLALNAIFEGEGSEKTRSVNTYSKAVRVEVSWGKFLADNWVTIVGVVIVPLTIAGLIPLLRWLAPNLWKSIRKDSAKRVEGFFRKR